MRGSGESISAPTVNPDHFLAVEIGGTKLQIVAGTSAGKILDRRRFSVDRAAGGEGIRAHIAEALPPLVAAWQPSAIGCGYGGPVDWRSGRINRSHHVAGWENFPLAEWLRERTGLPAAVDNDANVAALGEATHGAGRGANPVLYFNSGTGVGAGLVIDGAIYHGAPPGELELGHLRLERGGPIVEDRCSGREVDRLLRELAARHPEALIAQKIAGRPAGGEARQLAPAVAEGCPFATAFLLQVADDLAFALSHAVHLVHPAAIVFGGGLSLVGEPLRERIATALPRYVMEAFLPAPPVALAALGEDAVPVGALVLAQTAGRRN